MPRLVPLFSAFLVSIVPAHGKVVVFWQDGFPTMKASRFEADALQAFGNGEAVFAGHPISGRRGAQECGLLVLPYGSAVRPMPATNPRIPCRRRKSADSGWPPLCVPVTGRRRPLCRRKSAEHLLSPDRILHSYEVPQKNWVSFAWDEEFAYPGPAELRAQEGFMSRAGMGERRLSRLGFLSTPTENGSPLRWLKKNISQGEGDLKGARSSF